MKSSMLIRGFAALLVFVFMQTHVNAQTAEDNMIKQIMNEIDEKYSKRVEQALKKDMGKFNKMKSDLEEVDKVKDNNGKKKGLDNYKSAHKEHFGRSIQEAGVNLNQLLAGLQQKYPGYSFNIVDDYAIMVEKKSTTNGVAVFNGKEDNDADFLAIHPPTSHGPSQNIPGTFFQDLGFSQSKNTDCAVAGGGNVDLGYRSLRAYSTGVIIGGCSSTGLMNSRTALPAAAQSIKLNLTGTVECSGYAMGLIGTAYASSHNNLSLSAVEARAWLGGTGEYGSVVAPFLWYGSFNKSRSFNLSTDLTKYKGMTLNIDGAAVSNTAAGLCCGTTSTSRLSITTASLSVIR